MPSFRYPSAGELRAILVAVQLPEMEDADVRRSLSELENLLGSLGIGVADRIVQRRIQPSRVTYVGEGKLQELARLTGGTGELPRGPKTNLESLRTDLLVVADDELTPGQRRNLRAALGVEVIDRTEVILRVFESRPQSHASRLELELARLEYELPRIRDEHVDDDREGGGGRASRGHSNVELAKQRIRDRIAYLRKELARVHAVQDRSRRARSDQIRVALVGYTNAGKSSLMRRLTGREVFVEDRLFATLGTTVGQLSPPTVPPILVADTVGFIHRLPHQLVASFRSTLEEAKEASLLLHVVDVSDPAFRAQIRVTEEVLAEIGAGEIPTWLLLNKADRLDANAREAIAREFSEALLVSALDPRDVETIHRRLREHFARNFVEETIILPYARRGLLAEFADRLQIVREEYGESVAVTVRASEQVIAMLRARLTR